MCVCFCGVVHSRFARVCVFFLECIHTRFARVYVGMDPSGYLSFVSPTLVAESHAGKCVASVPPSTCGFYFSSKSAVSVYLKDRFRVGEAYSFFGGKLFIGPKWGGLLFSLVFLVAYAGQVVLLLTLPLHESHPFFCVWTNFDLVACFVFFFITAFSNPGIVPRGACEDGVARVDSNTGFLIPRFVLLNGVCVRQKFCPTCKIYRPPRSNHCSVCNNCVLKFDHHCVALGTCVGLGNYRWFLILIAALAGLGPPVAALAWPLLAWDRLNLILLFATTIIGFAALTMLLVYHVFITGHNLTTNEHLKKYYKVNPFDYGWTQNFIHCLCYPHTLLPTHNAPEIQASYKELASTNSECISDFYDY